MEHTSIGHIETLKLFNEWRRGGDVEQPKPKAVGESIDWVLALVDALQAEVVELTQENTRLISHVTNTLAELNRIDDTDKVMVNRKLITEVECEVDA